MQEQNELFLQCRDCTAREKAAAQKNLDGKPLASLIGRHVKVAFPFEGGGNEHMWCYVYDVYQGIIYCQLKNNPQFVDDFKFGDKLWISHDQIEAIN